MYISVYDVNGIHIWNIKNVVENISRKVYEFDIARFKGISTKLIEDATYAIFYTELGVKIYAGFIKNIVQDGNEIAFNFDDLRKLFDTEVLLDFSQSTPSHSLDDIFEKVMSEITSNDDTINIKIPIAYTIPVDATNTIEIADYTHDYVIVNAWAFLKVYLAYHSYYIEADFNVGLKRIEFTFIKQTATEKISLPDFIFDKKATSTNTNKAIATIKQVTNEASGDNVWGSSDSTAWDSADANDKSEGSELPSPVGYAEGFLFKLEVVSGVSWVVATVTDYANSSNRYTKSIDSGGTTCPGGAPSFAEIEAEAGDVNGYATGTVIRSNYYWVDGDSSGLCTLYGYIKKEATITYSYHIITTTIVYIPRPDYVEKIYILGNDNEIYIGYPVESLRLYPAKTKIFEDEFLSKSQFKAVQELVNSRYNENIFLQNFQSPIDLSIVELYTLFTIYDADKNVRILPVSEIKLNDGKYSIKLGFKKQLFTEIIKSKEE